METHTKIHGNALFCMTVFILQCNLNSLRQIFLQLLLGGWLLLFCSLSTSSHSATIIIRSWLWGGRYRHTLWVFLSRCAFAALAVSLESLSYWTKHNWMVLQWWTNISWYCIHNSISFDKILNTIGCTSYKTSNMLPSCAHTDDNLNQRF